MSNKLKWIHILDSVLGIEDFKNLTEEDAIKVQGFLDAGIPLDTLKQASLEYSLCYRSSTCWFKIRRKMLLKQALHELEKTFISEYPRAEQTSGWWRCYWNGERIIWRQESYSGSNGDSRLAYSARNSHIFRHRLRGNA